MCDQIVKGTTGYYKVGYAQYWTMAVKYGDINHSIK